jgi:hypothetical protein
MNVGRAARYRLKVGATNDLAVAAAEAFEATSRAADRMLMTMRRLDVLTGGRRPAEDLR